MNRPARSSAGWVRRAVAIRRATMLVVRSIRLFVGLVVARALGRPDDAEERLLRWARKTAASLDLRVHVEGDVPTGPVVLVTNHLSYLDIPLLCTLVPGVFVARADVAGWPGIGKATRALGTIFLDRDRKRALLEVLPEMSSALRDGRSVIFFPEATSTRGGEVLPFKSSLFEAAVRTGAPVVAASLHYETPDGNQSADEGVCWWGDMTFLPHLRSLLSLSGIEARIRFSEALRPSSEGFGADLPIRGNVGPNRPPHSRKRKELCRLAYEAVQKKFIPTTLPDSSGPPELPPPSRSGAAN